MRNETRSGKAFQSMMKNRIKSLGDDKETVDAILSTAISMLPLTPDFKREFNGYKYTFQAYQMAQYSIDIDIDDLALVSIGNVTMGLVLDGDTLHSMTLSDGKEVVRVTGHGKYQEMKGKRIRKLRKSEAHRVVSKTSWQSKYNGVDIIVHDGDVYEMAIEFASMYLNGYLRYVS